MEGDHRDEFYLAKGAGITMEKVPLRILTTCTGKKKVWIKCSEHGDTEAQKMVRF